LSRAEPFDTKGALAMSRKIRLSGLLAIAIGAALGYAVASGKILPNLRADDSQATNNGGQTTGVPGSPSATTTIDGKYLPPPPPKFGGTINLGAKDSKPWWPPQVVPPKGCAQRALDHDG
jgi:hypothetical protein